MRRSLELSLAVVGLFFAGSAFGQQAAVAPAQAPNRAPGQAMAQQAPAPEARPAPKHADAFATSADIPFDSTPNLLKLPSGMYMGEGIGVATNSKGHIFVYTRSGEASRLFEFNPDGTFAREIGHGLYGFQMAHAVRVDPQDNIWAVDEGTDTITKFGPDGRVVMVLGRRPEAIAGLLATPANGTPPPPARPYLFGRPTDVAWDKAGNIFISDGYTNSRVVKYDNNGKFIKDIGRRGTQPGEFNTPHGISVDSNGNVYVADRGNSRVQVLSNDLVVRNVYTNVGAPWSVCVTAGPHQYLYSSNSNPDNNDSRQAAVTGEIYKMELDGGIVGKFGHAGKQLGEFSTVHAIDCRNENQIFVGEITDWRIQKITLKTGTQTSSSN
jgi:hypothetical protein